MGLGRHMEDPWPTCHIDMCLALVPQACSSSQKALMEMVLPSSSNDGGLSFFSSSNELLEDAGDQRWPIVSLCAIVKGPQELCCYFICTGFLFAKKIERLCSQLIFDSFHEDRVL